MPRYIDADWIVRRLERWQRRLAETYGKNDEYVLCLGEALMVVDDAPNADVVKVVRCKDCKYAHMITFENGVQCLSCNYQNAHGMLVEDHGFCYWGEKEREDA